MTQSVNIPQPMTGIDYVAIINMLKRETLTAQAVLKRYSTDIRYTTNIESTERVKSILAHLAYGSGDPAAAWERFIEWQSEYPGDAHWDNYVVLRNEYEAEQKILLEKEKILRRQQKILLANSEVQAQSFQATKSHPQGPDNRTGKTIAGIVEVTTFKHWIGHSGIRNHVVPSHTKMTNLLSGVNQTEEWPIDVCAEVDAMKQALQDGADIDDLIFYCWTWDGKKNKWTGKTACSNCSQWIAKLKKPK